MSAELPAPTELRLKPCCGAVDGDWCDCAEFLAGLTTAPVIYLPAPYGRTHR